MESLLTNPYLEKVNPFFSGACDFKKRRVELEKEKFKEWKSASKLT